MSGVDKAEIRRQMRRLRRDLSEEEQQRAADGVYAQVMRMDCYRTARTVMAYAAVRGELSMPANHGGYTGFRTAACASSMRRKRRYGRLHHDGAASAQAGRIRYLGA